MLRCNEVTRLYASEEIRHASLWTRIAARMHLVMCRSCSRYVRELAAIGQAVRGLTHATLDTAERDESMIRRVLPDPPDDRD